MVWPFGLNIWRNGVGVRLRLLDGGGMGIYLNGLDGNVGFFAIWRTITGKWHQRC